MNNAHKILKYIWIVLTFAILFLSLYGFDGKPNSDIGIISAWSMLFLTFPSGLIISLIHMALFKLFSITIYTTYLSLILDWGGAFIAGYLQWFVIVPRLLKVGKMKYKCSQTNT